MARDDGGTAFPTMDAGELDKTPSLTSAGMSLRDWFAGQALAVVAQFGAVRKPDSLDHLDNTVGAANQISTWAYEIADAMLAAREE